MRRMSPVVTWLAITGMTVSCVRPSSPLEDRRVVSEAAVADLGTRPADAGTSACVDPIALGAVRADLCDESTAQDCRVRVPDVGHDVLTAGFSLCLLIDDFCRAEESLPWRLKRSLAPSGLRLDCAMGTKTEICDITGCARVQLGRRCPFVRPASHLSAPPLAGLKVWRLEEVRGRPSLVPRIPESFRRQYRRTFEGADAERRLEAALFYAQQLSRESRFEGMVDAYEAPVPVRNLSPAIGMMVPSGFVEPGPRCLEIDVGRTAQAPGTGELCACEPFAEDPRVRAPAPCTVFALDDHYLATAGHCIDIPESCANAQGRHCTLSEDPNSPHTILFAFRREDEVDQAIDLQPHHVIDGSRVEVLCYSRPPDDHDDWALLRAVDPLPGGTYVTLSVDPPNEGEEVSALGHVLAAPLKYSIPGPVRDVTAENFLAEIDGFAGNSGSPVFAADGQVVGIFRGVGDAALHECPPGSNPANCYYLPRCPAGDCLSPTLVMHVERLRSAYNRAISGDAEPCNHDPKEN